MIADQLLPLPPVNRQEVLRYASASGETEALSRLMEDAIAEAEPLLCPRICLQQFSIRPSGDSLDLGFAKTTSRDLSRHLNHCHQVIVFGATLGLALDRAVSRYGHIAPARALMLNAIGAERIEALCDSLCQQLQNAADRDGLHLTDRFSPGYGDLSLEFQKELFRALDCPRRIGLTLTDSLLMSPAKSVTGLIGISRHCTGSAATGCAHCPKTDCIHRRHP